LVSVSGGPVLLQVDDKPLYGIVDALR